MKASVFVYGAAVLCASVLTACGNGGGGGGTASNSLTGVFADSPVSGLTYVINGLPAKTDATGHFSYKAGDSITFKVGDIVLGTAIGKPFLSPVALVTGATDETDNTVTNLSKFLQTIDDDNNPANGIQLTTAIHTAALFRSINFAQAPGNYDVDGAVTNAYGALTGAAASGMHAAVTDATAKSHLRSTLFAAMAGTYKGTFSGAGTGTFTFTTDSAGAISLGQIVQAPSGAIIPIAGAISSSGSFSSPNNAGLLNGTVVNLNFSGNVNASTSTVSGTWAITGVGINLVGTFSGQK